MGGRDGNVHDDKQDRKISTVPERAKGEIQMTR
jgi:hypothetical protein